VAYPSYFGVTPFVPVSSYPVYFPGYRAPRHYPRRPRLVYFSESYYDNPYYGYNNYDDSYGYDNYYD
jgi:hypothetical protein